MLHRSHCSDFIGMTFHWAIKIRNPRLGDMYRDLIMPRLISVESAICHLRTNNPLISDAPEWDRLRLSWQPIATDQRQQDGQA